MRYRIVPLLLAYIIGTPATAHSSDLNEFCNILVEDGLKPIRPYQTNGFDYDCISGYLKLESNRPLPNNITYYVTGTESSVAEVFLVLSVKLLTKADNVYKDSAHKILLTYSNKLISSILGKDLTSEMKKSILTGSPSTWDLDNGKVEIKREDWDTGKGYEVHFIIHPKTSQLAK